jgi:hypothetical protein
MSTAPRKGGGGRRAAHEHDLLLRNRGAHLRDRDAAYREALGDLENLVQKLRVLRETAGGLQQIKQGVERLALSFKRALYHAVLAAGGDFGRTRVTGIGREEMVFSDYLKTMYSAARNVESYLSHELMLHRFAESEEELEAHVRDYILQTKTYDQDIILRNLDLMVSRASIFDKTFMARPAEGSGSSSAGTAVEL